LTDKEGGAEGRLGLYSKLVMLPHTVFAMPFALTAVVLASYSYRVTVSEILLIIVAFTGARSAAMGFNRLIDHGVDSRNPRTRGRPLPAGKLTRLQAWLFVAVSVAVFELAAWLLGPLPLLLSPLALAVVLLYSVTKFFTAASHLVLGLALSIAPVGAWIAVTGGFGTGVIVLAAAVLCWVAGFDVIYSLQDEQFDRTEGLHSIPARLGARGALWISRALHVAAVALLAWSGIFFPVGVFYWIAWVAVASMLIYEHCLVSADDISRVDAAFFTVNGIVSVVFFLLNLVDRLV
jgi:4-hydroxybenzoate polyprenyltransferase